MQLVKSAIASVAVVSLLVACSSDSPTPASDAGATDAKKDTAVVTDTGVGDGATTTCKPQDVSSFQPAAGTSPVVAAGACTAKDLTDYYAACIDPGNQNDCDAFEKNAAKANCVKCMYTLDSASKLGAITEDDQQIIHVNIAGCLEVKGDAACAKAVRDSDQCGDAACPGTVCPVPADDTGAAFDALQACLSKADDTVCKTYADKADCGSVEADGGTAAALACVAPPSTTDFFYDSFLKIGQVLCIDGK